MSDLLVVVPTRQAGRRLREGLARHAAECEAAVLPPQVVTPNFLFAPARLGETVPPVASPQAAGLIWTALLWSAPLESYRRAFPVDPVQQDLVWGAGAAGDLLAARDLLIESGLDFEAAAERLAEEGIEASRWRDLAALERAASERFASLGLRDPGAASLEAALRGELPPGIRKVVVASVPDLRHLAAKALARHARTIPVTVLVAAPEREADVFDEFGRPLPDAWKDREIAFADPEGSLHAGETPVEQARRCRALLSGYSTPAAIAAIGLPDPELAPTLRESLAKDGIVTYDPAGRPVAREGIVHLLRLVRDLAVSEHFTGLRALLRCPGVAAALLLGRARDSVSAGRLLKDADELVASHFPADLDQALHGLRRRPGGGGSLGEVVEGAQALVGRLRTGDFGTELCAFLSTVFAEKRLAEHDKEKAVFSEVADAIHSLGRDIELVSEAFPRAPGLADRFHLLLDSLGQRRVYDDRGPRDLELQGWLELIWEDAPHLIVAGMNDHAVPEAVVGHALLPDSARRLLGVPDNEARFARDAFVLALLVETRRESGRLDLLFGRLGPGGDPLRPSRLLFQCPDGELAARTLRLFRKAGEAPAPSARTLAWRLRPPALPSDHRLFRSIRATAFKDYLACPFRYYLRHGLGMGQVEAEKAELGAGDFGDLVHSALEAYGRDGSLRGSADAAAIAACFESAVEAWFSSRFGSRLSTPLLIQREAARRRLERWAAIEAEQRAVGWEIVEVECDFGKEAWPFEVAGMPVTGRIDRLERHPEEGLRVFDFKTRSPMEGGKLVGVDRFHLVPAGRGGGGASLPDWSRTADGKGKLLRWIDLQVPLYHLAVAERFPGVPVSAGYVTLGRTAEEVRIDPWTGLEGELLESARACAAGVVEAIRDGVFWPPNERMPAWDEFHGLLLPRAAEAVDPSEILGARG